jgi:hypothetical protein
MKTLTRSEFEALGPVEQRQKVLVEKYTIVDNPKPPVNKPRPGGKVLSRADFNALTPFEQRQRVTVEKYTIVD